MKPSTLNRKKAKKKEPSHKSTAAEIDTRCTQVQMWLLQGDTRHEILQNAAKWHVSNRAVDEYIARAKEKIMETNTATVEENTAVITRNIWRIFRLAMQVGDLSEANKALMNLAKVKGVGVITVNATIGPREFAELSDEELERRLEGMSQNGG